METKAKVIEKIAIDKEILSTLPKNNKKNAEACIEEIQKTYSRYNEIKNKVIEQFEIRKEKCQRFAPNEDILVVKKRLAEIEYKAIFLNPYNTAYEKTGLDRIVYDISKYYKNNLVKVNTDILSALSVFKTVGVELTSDDFLYSTFAKEYMTVFFEEINDLESEKMKHTFEKIYWKKPNIIKHIQLNFRQLYYKYINEFEKYCVEEVRAFNDVSLMDKAAVVDEYKNYKEMYDQLHNQSEYLYLQKFGDKTLDINNFSAKKIFDLYKVFTDTVEIDDHINTSIIKFNKTITEYKNYFKFKFIVDNVKDIYSNKEKDKDNSSKKKLAEIKKLEQSLDINEKKSVLKMFSKKKIDIDKTIDDLMNLYNEIDDLIFKEKVFEIITEDSKISDLLELASSYYIYIARLLKVINPEILDETIYEITDSLKQYLIGEHKLICNLNAFIDYDIPMIISDKYKLDNLKVTMDMIKEENLDSLINQTNNLINYYHITHLRNLSITEIEDYLKILKKLGEISSKAN